MMKNVLLFAGGILVGLYLNKTPNVTQRASTTPAIETIRLPMIIGTAEAADALLDELETPADLTNRIVKIQARNVSTIVYPFTEKLLKNLTERDPIFILITGAPTEVEKQVKLAIKNNKLTNIHIGTTDDLIILANKTLQTQIAKTSATAKRRS